jgi:hypothetical protein
MVYHVPSTSAISYLKTTLMLLGGLAASCGGGTDSGPPGTIAVWTQGVGQKVQPTTAPGAGTSIAVASCRKAYASWQLVVTGQGGGLQQVSAAVTDDLSDGMGHTLSKSNVTLFREYFIDFSGVSANTGNVPAPAKSATQDGKVPDPLIPLVDPYTGMNAGQPFDVVAGTNQPLFVDVYVPAGTVAGTYTGHIHVSAGSGGATDVPLAVTVWNLDLPDMRSVTTHFKMSINSLYYYHAGLSKCSGGSCYLDVNPQSLAVVKRYEELAHAHRIDTAQQLIQAPVSGCSVPTDWSAYDAGMGPYFDGSYFSDGVPSSRFDPPFSPGETYGLDACNQAQYAALSTAWATHLKSKGWFQKAIVYALDEPATSDFPKIAQGSAWLQQGDASWKAHVMDTTSPDPTNAPTLNPALGIYTVNLPWYDDWNAHGPYYGRQQWPGLFTQGIQLWFYESNSVLPPYPTFASNTLDGLEPVIAMWGSWYENATGFLYWDIAAWDDSNPWGPETKWGLTGDGVLIYPGNHAGTTSPMGSPTDVAIDGPIPSYRLKMIRNGLQDWALFVLAGQKGLTATVQQKVATVYGQFGGCSYSGCPAPVSGFYWKSDEAAMAQIRQAVVQAIGP